MAGEIQRRELLRAVGAGVIGSAVGSGVAGGADTPSTKPSVGSIADLPKRKLGRIGIEVPVLSFGSAPMGHAFFRAEPFEEVMIAAIEAGITYIDTAPIYDVAQERLAPVLAKYRKQVFLVTKSHERTGQRMLADIERSLAAMKVENADLCHVHNLGEFTYEEVAGKGGMLEALEEAKKRGWIKYIGVSGHLRPARFEAVLDTGKIDLVMNAMNFVDRHTYGFEDKVMPIAQKHNCGIVAMKVLGGNAGGFGGYKKREPGNLVTHELRQWAVDYALSLPISTMVVGMKTLDELRLMIEAVRNHKPLDGERRDMVLAKGRELAPSWGEHFGPVV